MAVAAPVVCAKATAAVTLTAAAKAIAPQQRQSTIADIAATINPDAATINSAKHVRSTTGMASDTGTPNTSGPW